MVRPCYMAGVRLYFFAIKAAALFNRKAALFYKGRKNLFRNLAENLPEKNAPLVWFHAASLGEFEQGRPVMELLKKEMPSIRILLTFFSPSGFEVRKDYKGADYVCYLPTESLKNVRQFFDLTNPSIAVFIKYEFWREYILEAYRRKIKLVSASSVFRENQIFFRWYGQFFREVLRHFSHFFVQNEASSHLLQSIGIEQVTVAGDTRFDRVLEISKQAGKIAKAEKFKGNEKVVVLGSVWPSDMQVLHQAISLLMEKVKLIIAPHQIEPYFLNKIELLYPEKCLRFSKSSTEALQTARILLIDNIGMLSSLYGYADVAFVGGGFRGALHNTLEPAAFGIPVLWGDHEKNKKHREAEGLRLSGGGEALKSRKDTAETLDRLLHNEPLRKQKGSASLQYVESNVGASQKIVSYLMARLQSQ